MKRSTTLESNIYCECTHELRLTGPNGNFDLGFRFNRGAFHVPNLMHNLRYFIFTGKHCRLLYIVKMNWVWLIKFDVWISCRNCIIWADPLAIKFEYIKSSTFKLGVPCENVTSTRRIRLKEVSLTSSCINLLYFSGPRKRERTRTAKIQPHLRLLRSIIMSSIV